MGKRYTRRLEYVVVGLVMIVLGLLVSVVDESRFIAQDRQENRTYDDFPFSDQGRFKGTLAPGYYQIPLAAVLFSSGSVPGIALLYYPKTRMLLAGSPFMQAKVSLFDGQPHELEYVFGEGRQKLYYDGTLVASGTFRKQEGSMGLAEGLQLSEKFEAVVIE